MPLYSCFTRYGLLQYSGARSDGEKIYRTMVRSYTDPRSGRPVFDVTPGTDVEARIYATAMAAAAARAAVQRAANQSNPGKAYDALPAWEKTFELAPAPTDMLKARRAAVAARAQLSRGARLEAINDGLQQILGANFIKYRPVASGEATSWPSDPSTGPGLFARPELPAKVVRILDPVLSATPTLSYENWDTTQPDILLVNGDVLCVQAENEGLAERVTVTAASGTGDARTFTATFANAHDINASATTGPVPMWWSTKRLALIVVKAAAAVDVLTRQLVDEFMRRAARVVSEWAIVEPTTPGASTVGPFTLGSSPLGVVTVGTITI